MCIDLALAKENKSLRKENEELKKKLQANKDWLLQEVMNSYLKDRNQLEDFKEYTKTYKVKYSQKNELAEFWEKI